MPYIITKGGRRHELGKPFTPEIGEIAFALSHINRFTGHAGVYSVAEHCVLCADMALVYHPGGDPLSALLHDAPEAWLGDVSAPLKSMIGPEYAELEGFYHNEIDAYFNVRTRAAWVKQLDKQMLATELGLLGHLRTPDPAVHVDATPLAVSLQHWSPARAESEFLRMFNKLTARRGR